MRATDGWRPRLVALLAALPLAGATLGGALHATPASAATGAQVAHLMDVNGASVAERNDHGGDHKSDRSDRSDRGDRGDRHDRHDRGDRADRGGDRGERDHNGAECHNCGVDNGGDRSGGGERKGGEGGCGGPHESLLEALVDGLCAGAETLERGLTGAR